MPHLAVASLQFVSMDPEAEGAVAFRFEPRRPLRFRAGQHGLWVLPRAGINPFTVASAPEEDLVMLGTTVTSQSRFKRALAALPVGSTARLIGPIQSFTLDRTAPSVVMLAQGIGVTPFRSMLRHAAMSGLDKRTTLIHVGAQHAFRVDTEADAGEALYPTSREAFAREAEAAALQQPDATFMVSGAPAFVKSTVALLKANSIDRSQIRRDSFFGYRSRA